MGNLIVLSKINKKVAAWRDPDLANIEQVGLDFIDSCLDKFSKCPMVLRCCPRALGRACSNCAESFNF